MSERESGWFAMWTCGCCILTRDRAETADVCPRHGAHLIAPRERVSGPQMLWGFHPDDDQDALDFGGVA